MAKGAISRLITDRGFGFIKIEQGEDLFFHRNELQGVDYDSLKEGQQVEFEVGQGRNGRPQAINVRLSPFSEVKVDKISKVEMRNDGACSGNPGPGGWCAILTYGEHRKELSGHVDDTTNQRIELMAAIEGLKALKRHCEVTVYCDSEYVAKGVNEHQRHEENLDLWASLHDLLTKHSVTWVKATEGSGDLLFDECHKIAKSRDFV